MPRYHITNNARGPRMVLTPAGGKTIRPGETETIKLSENELKTIKPYVANGDLSVREAKDDESEGAVEPASLGFNATPSSNGASADATNAKNVPVEGLDGDLNLDNGDDNGPDVTHVEHKGFGRWYGMKGDERVTEAMTRAEAEAFAEEHKVQMGNEPDPASEDDAPTDESPPTDPPPAPDNQ